jgi:hypothetical protein
LFPRRVEVVEVRHHPVVPASAAADSSRSFGRRLVVDKVPALSTAVARFCPRTSSAAAHGGIRQPPAVHARNGLSRLRRYGSSRMIGLCTLHSFPLFQQIALRLWRIRDRSLAELIRPRADI